MQPLPEVQQAIDRLSALLEGDQDIRRHFSVVTSVAELLVPALVGVSITVHINGQPFTMTAASDELAAVDAVQYLDGGPCVDALDGIELSVEDILNEERWQLYRPAALQAGVSSSLSLPLRGTDESVIGALNLYGADPGTFRGQEEMLAEVFGARVSELVTNADLTFMTRDWARELPQRVEALEQTERAVGILVATRGWPPDEARSRLVDAAGRAGAPVDKVAQALLALTG